MKSKLFVPASRPDLFPKAFASAADAISFDLSDTVLEPHKDEARATLRTLLLTRDALPPYKTIVVRVNALGSPHFAADIAAVAQSGVALINLPKLRNADEVRAAAQALSEAEHANGVTEPIGLLVNIETPSALRRAYELASAHERVRGLQLDLSDLLKPLGIARRETTAMLQAMFMLSLAAGEAGVFAFDSAFTDVRDKDAFRREAQLAKNLGFVGKTCIDLSQIPLVNAVFRPSDAEIAHGQRIVATAERVEVQGGAAPKSPDPVSHSQ